MPLFIPTGYYQVSYYHHLSNTDRDAVCTIGAQYIGTTFLDDAANIGAAWGTVIMPVLSSGVTYYRFTLQDEVGTVYEGTSNTAGGITEPSCPWNTAYLIKKTTNSPGRWNTGRMFLPGVEEGKVDNAGLIDTAKRTAINTAVTNLGIAYGAADFNPVLLHNRAVGDVEPPRAPTGLSALVCDERVATQRRRLRG